MKIESDEPLNLFDQSQVRRTPCSIHSRAPLWITAAALSFILTPSLSPAVSPTRPHTPASTPVAAIPSPVQASPPASPQPASSQPESPQTPAPSQPAGKRSSRSGVRYQVLHGTIKSLDATSMLISGAGPPNLKVVLSPRGHLLRSGKASSFGAFHAGEMVTFRGHFSQADLFTATLIMDSDSEKLAGLTRRAPLMKVTAMDNTTGLVTLSTENADIRVQVLRSRIRMGRKELGATSNLQVGQLYGVRLNSAPDGQPDVTLSTESGTGSSQRTSRKKGK